MGDIRMKYQEHRYINQKLPIEGKNPALFPYRNNQHCKQLLQTSKDFELVLLHPFMGSGTTGRVCDKLGRSFVGYDLKKYY